MHDYRQADLEPRARCLCDFAVKVTREPSEITVAPGDTVTWTNNEAVPHDVKKDSGPGPDFNSGPEGGMGDGDTFKHTFEEAGNYNYICRVHAPGMAGTVNVK